MLLLNFTLRMKSVRHLINVMVTSSWFAWSVVDNVGLILVSFQPKTINLVFACMKDRQVIDLCLELPKSHKACMKGRQVIDLCLELPKSPKACMKERQVIDLCLEYVIVLTLYCLM
jgi:hypothetical protein